MLNNRSVQSPKTAGNSTVSPSASFVQTDSVPVAFQKLDQDLKAANAASQKTKAKTKAQVEIQELLGPPEQETPESPALVAATEPSKELKDPESAEPEKPAITQEEVKRILGITDEPETPPFPFILP